MKWLPKMDGFRVTEDGLKMWQRDNGGNRRRGTMSKSKRIYVLWIAALGLACGSLPARTPKLPEITSVPSSAPYRWDNVVIRAGGFVSGLEFSPTVKGLVYARTDVGGAYRSEDAGEHWTPLNDRFGRDDSTYLGIEVIALDPEDGNKLYLAEGMYTGDWGGPSAIFRSNDRGRTFEKTAMPFKMGATTMGVAWDLGYRWIRTWGLCCTLGRARRGCGRARTGR